jgi:hypothetical protein
LPEDDKKQLEGFIMDKSGQGIECAVVSILKEKRALVATAVSDERGYFSLSGNKELQIGQTFTAEVDAPGYTKPRARDFTLTAGEVLFLDFRVEPDQTDPRHRPLKGRRGFAEAEIRKFTGEQSDSLTGWLDGEAKAGRRILMILPLENDSSLFVFEKMQADISSKAVRGNGSVSAPEFNSQKRNFEGKTFVGVHKYRGGFFMVFYD